MLMHKKRKKRKVHFKLKREYLCTLELHRGDTKTLIFGCWWQRHVFFFKEQGTKSFLVGPAVQICISPLRELKYATEQEGWRVD